jgi:hypothetical protein
MLWGLARSRYYDFTHTYKQFFSIVAAIENQLALARMRIIFTRMAANENYSQ